MADVVSVQCRTYARYLVGQAPDAHVQAKYRDALVRVPELAAPAGGFEALLLRLSTLHPWVTRAVDGYCRFFRPGAIVRKRLVLMFALLESFGATTRHFDDSDGGGVVGFALRLAWAGLCLATLLSLSAVILLPLSWIMPTGLPARPKGGA